MALSRLICGISSSPIKVKLLKNLKGHILRSSTICVNSQPYHYQKQYHHHLLLNKNQFKQFDISNNYKRQYVFSEGFGKNFSTTLMKSAEHKGHDHSKIWGLERILSFLLLPLVPAALVNPCQQLDTVLALLIVMHSHFGIEAIIVDYIRPILFGNLAPKIGIGLLYVFSIVVFAGLLNLIYNDTGLANTIINVWKK